MITLEHISVIYNLGAPAEQAVLNDLNLTLNKGEFVTLVGGNGAGKSTLIKAITGQQPLTRGSISIHGQAVTAWSAAKRSRMVGQVFQNPCLGTFGALTVAENMAIGWNAKEGGALNIGLNVAMRRHFYKLLADLNMGLEEKLNWRMDQLSGGQRQVISLVMALLRPTQILLLDEHTSALDAKATRLVLDVTQQLVAERNLTTLMITHNLRDALSFGTRTVCLKHGKIVADYQQSERASMDPAALSAIAFESYATA